VVEPSTGSIVPPGTSLHIAVSEWTEVLRTERLTGTLLDRLTHRTHILEMNLDG
jgi:hypothetical protein